MKSLICNLAYFFIRLKFWEVSVVWDLWKNPDDWEELKNEDSLNDQ